MAEEPVRSSYTTVIDLTRRAQQKKQEAAARAREEPLPEVSLAELPERMQQAARAMGWTELMPVQRRTLPFLLAGRDVIVQSQTGSGKTGAFLLPLFERLDVALAQVQALILTPTRELARQIFETFERMKAGVQEAQSLRAVPVYGGVRYGPQLKALAQGAQVVVGTPGRVLDLIEQGAIRLAALKVLVFDEADEMLSMGFYPAMRQLKRYLPPTRSTSMFSATIPPRVQALAREFLKEPAFVSLSADQITAETIEHRYFIVPPMAKDRALVQLIELENPESAIIFANTKRDVEYLGQFLKNYGYNADAITGDLPQKQRERIMDQLRKGKLRLLIATDVAARGIDISDLSHVFMYDVPQDPEYYVHRSGRTGRVGKTGITIVLVTPLEEARLQAIARQYDIPLERRTLPTPETVAERVAERAVALLEDRYRERTSLDRERLARFVPLVTQLAQEEPELLAMLVDELYVQEGYRAGVRPQPELMQAAREKDTTFQKKRRRSRRKKS
ncbi:DEAD/DEAH box helicase [Rhodothermus profundi]|uniref:ATP-dependent RNA helicase DeaD n=1 Tax=Rhodothermus profundi TaxID=633813 RepID=A0A1M6R7T7_9BACT|nr:DEAD/DEAH box helicase [Rhodothermus profundi]SHK28387.1 ATP-dependent RNA helicase DeaD [Rhodothermus profundi]